MKRKLMIITLLMLTLTLTACGNPKLKNGESVVVKIDGFNVTADDLYKEMKKDSGYQIAIEKVNNYIASKEIPDSDEINQKVDELFDYYKSYSANSGLDLIQFLQYYGGLNVETEDDFKEYLKNDYKLSEAIKKQIGETISDEEIETYYNEKYSEILTVRHILIEFDEDDDEYDEAYNTALNIIGKLNETEEKDLTEKFNELAKEYSADSSANNGGLIEDFVAGDVVTEFYQASTELEDGKYTLEPVKTQFGYHIILKVSEKEKPSLKDAKEEIKDKLAQTKLSDNKETSKALLELHKKYNIKIYDTDIDSTYNQYKESLN